MPAKQTTTRSGRRWPDVYTALGERFGRRLFDEVMASSDLRPRITGGRVVAAIVAGLVHGVTLGALAAGIVFGLTRQFVPAAICLIVFWVIRPRLGKPPEGTVPRSKLPRLYELVDRVWAAERARAVSSIVLTTDFNANVRAVGWRRRTYLSIGLPLFAILEPQERVALLAHEAGHLVNGDPMKGGFVGTALQTLQTWYGLLRPPARRPRSRGLIADFAEMLARPLMAGIAAVVRWIAVGLLHLVWAESQRAEYLADHLARTVAGSTATASLFDKFRFAPAIRQTIQSAAITRTAPAEMFGRLRASVAAGQAVTEQHRDFRLDATHPPTPYRIEFVRLKSTQPTVVLSSGDAALIDKELAPFEKRVAEEAVDAYRASLYR